MTGPAKLAAIVSAAVWLVALPLQSADATDINADPASTNERRPASLRLGSYSATLMPFLTTDVGESEPGGVSIRMAHCRRYPWAELGKSDAGDVSMRMVHARWDRFSDAAGLFSLSEEAPFELAALAIGNALRWGLSLTPAVFGFDDPYCTPGNLAYHAPVFSVLTLHFVPEPSPAALVSIGLVGLGVLGKRRKEQPIGGIRFGRTSR